MSMLRLTAVLFAVPCILLSLPRAEAAVMLLRVGAGADCDYRTDSLPNALQSAINAVPTSISTGDAYVIRVARNGHYAGAKVEVLNRTVIIEGGYATCSSATPGTNNTVIDAQSLLSGPVMRINGETAQRRVSLRNITIQGGSGGTGHGLLIHNADVELARVTVQENLGATYGAGIRIDGAGLGATLHLHANSSVASNEANQDGGGIHCSGGASLRLDADSSVIANIAESNGGGIAIQGCNASINSGASGLAGLFVSIGFNEANVGGGIAVLPGGRSTVFMGSLEGSNNDTRPLIINNTATSQGGGIYVSGSNSQLDIRNALIANNDGGSMGGGIMVRGGARVKMGRTSRRCEGTGCSRLIDNVAAWGGAIGVADAVAQVWMTRIEGNHADSGGSAYFALNNEAVLASESNVIVKNTGASTVEISPGSGAPPRVARVWLLADTIADNSGGGAVINANAEGHVTLGRTIVHAVPSLPVLLRAGPLSNAEMHCNVFHSQAGVSSDYDTLTSFTATPGFVDAAAGNYRLRPDAWAIDRCPANGDFLPIDHAFSVRPVDSPLGDIAGPFDVGAHEWTPMLFADGFES